MRELKCLRCGTMMEYKGTKEFQMGHTNMITGDWSHIWQGSIEFDIYECPECGKAEMFKPQNVEHKNESEIVEVEVPKTDRSKLKDRRFGF